MTAANSSSRDTFHACRASVTPLGTRAVLCKGPGCGLPAASKLAAQYKNPNTQSGMLRPRPCSTPSRARTPRWPRASCLAALPRPPISTTIGWSRPRASRASPKPMRNAHAWSKPRSPARTSSPERASPSCTSRSASTIQTPATSRTATGPTASAWPKTSTRPCRTNCWTPSRAALREPATRYQRRALDRDRLANTGGHGAHRDRGWPAVGARQHRNPFDRMLIAQARSERLTLVTHDHALVTYGVTVMLASE